MPIPTAICCICNQPVAKSQTLSIGEGKRACRSHPETQTLADQAQQKLETRYQVGRVDQRRKREDVSTGWDFRPICMVCRKTGIFREQLFERLFFDSVVREMMNQEQLFIKFIKGINPLRKVIGLQEGETVIVRFTNPEKFPPQTFGRLDQLVHSKYRPVWSAGVGAVCVGCIMKYDLGGILVTTDVPLETLETLAPIVDEVKSTIKNTIAKSN